VNSQSDQQSREKILTATADGGLPRSGDRFALAFHAGPDPILLTRVSDGKILEVNEAFERLYGLSAKEAVGRSTLELGIWPDTEKRREMVEILRTQGRVRNFEFAAVMHSGEQRTGTVSAESILIDGEPCLVAIFRDVTLQKKAEQALRDSEGRFHSLAAAAFEGIAISEDGRIIEANDQLADMLGYTRDELIGRPVSDLVAAESRPLVEQMIATGNEGPYEHLSRCKDGSTIPVEVRARAFFSGNRQLRVTSVRDITARKAAEDALRASEQRFRGYFEMGLVGMAVTSPEKGFVRFNDRMCEILGYSREELATKSWVELTHPDDLQADLAQFQRLLTAEIDGYELDKRFIRKDRSIVHTHIFAKCVRDADGNIADLVAMAQDITERKKSEEALRKSEERFELAVRASNEGIWDWDIRAKRVFRSPRVLELLGYEPGELPDAPEFFEEHMHPDDREIRWKAIRDHLEKRRPYDIEFRLRRKNGEYRWFRARGQAVWDKSGTAVRMAGSISDIHEHRLAEESLRQAQRRALDAREEFTQRLISAQEQERKRLANELHDSLGQNLSLIQNRMQMALAERDVPPAAAGHLEAIGRVVTEAIAEVRNLAQNLRPLHIDQFGVTDALESLVAQVAESTPIQIEKRIENVDDVFRGDEATTLYRILQEGLNNLVKHSRAAQAKISVERDLHCVRVRLEDNGRGFDMSSVAAARRVRTGIGLTSISERVRMLGGSFHIQSVPGQGTRIWIELPTGR
jgi:PAS domain S-box-containing protein